MNPLHSYSDRTRLQNGESRDIDHLLREFFRSEMPYPWPAPPAVTEEVKPLVSKKLTFPKQWQRSRRYLALAAAVALFIVGYWTLSWAFPEFAPGNNLLKSKHSIATPLEQLPIDPNDPAGQITPQTIPTPSGGARLWEHKDNNKLFMRLEALPKNK